MVSSSAIPGQAQNPDSAATLPAYRYQPPQLTTIPGDSVMLTNFLPLQEQLRRVAGVQATPYSGAPGAGMVVRIRGAASLAQEAQPLYVVDGVPAFQHTFKLNHDAVTPTGNGFQPVEALELDNNPLLSLPIEDIASVEVLKGALETARYGFQGVNGVIRITTRRGQAGAPRLRYSGYGGVQQARSRYQLLDAQEYAVLANESSLNAGKAPLFSEEQIARLGKGTDWQSELLRTATVQDHHLSVDGGTARTHYYTSADYLSQNGILLNSTLRRASARLGLEQQVGQRLHLAAGIGISQTRQRLPFHYVLENALYAAPTTPVRNPDGSYTIDGSVVNPVKQAKEHYQTPRQDRLLTYLEARYQFLPGLLLAVKGNLEQASLRSNSYSSPYPGDAAGAHGELQATYQDWTLNPALRFTHSLGEGRHILSADLEALAQKSLYEDMRKEYVPVDPRIISGGWAIGKSGASYESEKLGTLLQTSYTFANRYQLQGSLRRDASSAFALNDRWEWLPGVQATWHVAQESFLPRKDAISKLDAWVGWGHTSGSGNLGRNYFQIAVPSPGTPDGRAAMLVHDRIRQLEAGILAGLWQNRLTAGVTAYSRRSGIGNAVKSYPFSHNEPNFYKVQNTGLELTATGRWQAGRFTGTTTLAAAANHNQYQSQLYPFRFPYQSTTEGQPFSTFFGLRYEGVDATGAPRFHDANGDGEINNEDRQALGSGLPRQLISIGQQISYERFSLDAQLDGMFGYQVFNVPLRYLDSPIVYGFNASGRILERWTPDNQETDVPRTGQDISQYGMTSYNLQSGNHVRLTSLTLICKVWQKEVRSISVWAGGHNLLVLSKYRGFDPNVSSAGADSQQAGLDTGAYPTARTFLLGVQATL
ncbi:hypothetical protein PK28_00485 [Hymenobacter sp. DG25B]|nr:hypothetical protein PK28_00485 [Hymenobacter sp. DG25B]